MYVGKTVGYLRGLNDHLMRAWVVVGDGKNAGMIKGVRYHKNVFSHLLTMEMAKTASGEPAIADINLKGEYQRRGWRFLKDLYEEEGRLDDWEEFLRYQEYSDRGQTRQEFPEYLLPNAVVELRKKSKDFANGWKPKKNPPSTDGPKHGTQKKA